MHSRGRSGHLPPGRGRRGDTDTNAGFQNPAAGQFRGSLTYRPQQGPRSPAMERRQGGNIPPYQQQPLAPWQMQAAQQQVQTPQYFAYSNREQVDPYRNLAHPLPPGLANPAAIVQMNSRHHHRATEVQNFGPVATYNHRYPTTNVGHNQMSTMQRPGGSINSYESRNHMVERQSPSQAIQSYSHYINPANYFGQQYAGYPTEHPGYFTNEYTARFPNAYSGTSADSTPYQRNPPAPGPFGDASYYQQVVGQPSHNTPPQVPALPVSVASPQQPPRQLGFAGAPPTKQSNGVTPELVDLDNEDNGSVGEDVDKEDNRSKGGDVDNDRENEEHGAEKRNDESIANGKSTDGSTESSSDCTDEGTSEYESSSDSTYMVRKNETILEILREGLKRNLSEDTAADQQLIKCFRVCEHVYSSSSDPELENEYDENLRKKLKSCSQYEVGGVLIEVPVWQSSHATSDHDVIKMEKDVSIKTETEETTAEETGIAENTTAFEEVKCESEPRLDDYKIELEPGLNDYKIELEPGLNDYNIELEPGLNELKIEPEPTLNELKIEPEPTLNELKIEPELSLDDLKIEPEPSLNDLKIEVNDELQRDVWSELNDFDHNASNNGSVDASTPEYWSDDQTRSPDDKSRLNSFVSEIKRKEMLKDPSGPVPWFLSGLLRKFTIAHRLQNLKDCEMKIVGVPKVAGKFRAALCRELEISKGIGLHGKDEIVNILEDYNRKMKYMIYLMDCESDETFNIEEFLGHAKLLKPLIQAKKVDFFITKSQDADGPNIDMDGWRKLSEIIGSRFTMLFYNSNDPDTFNEQINACKSKYLRLAISQ